MSVFDISRADCIFLTLLYSERPKLIGVLAVLNAIGLSIVCNQLLQLYTARTALSDSVIRSAKIS